MYLSWRRHLPFTDKGDLEEAAGADVGADGDDDASEMLSRSTDPTECQYREAAPSEHAVLISDPPRDRCTLIERERDRERERENEGERVRESE